MFLTPEGFDRLIVGDQMPDPNTGGEAVHLFVLEDGSKGMRIIHEGGQILIGKLQANPDMFGTDAPFAGIRLLDRAGKVVWEQNVLAPAPAPGPAE